MEICICNFFALTYVFMHFILNLNAVNICNSCKMHSKLQKHFTFKIIFSFLNIFSHFGVNLKIDCMQLHTLYTGWI